MRSPAKLCANQPPHALKAQHKIAQGNALGIMAFKFKPCKGGTKSVPHITLIQRNFIFLAKLAELSFEIALLRVFMTAQGNALGISAFK